MVSSVFPGGPLVSSGVPWFPDGLGKFSEFPHSPLSYQGSLVSRSPGGGPGFLRCPLGSQGGNQNCGEGPGLPRGGPGFPWSWGRSLGPGGPLGSWEVPWFPGILGRVPGVSGNLWIPGRPPGFRGPGEGRWGLWECPLGSWGGPRFPGVLGRVPRNMSSGVHPPASPVIGMPLGCLICWQNERREKLREKLREKKRFIFQ
jgi:hypothetical protein